MKKEFLIRGIEYETYQSLKIEAEKNNQSLNTYIKEELKNNLSSKKLNRNFEETKDINRILIEVVERNNFLISLLIDKLNEK
ncbi:hypothetical protein [Hutsoniella sourekii]|uniref:hypothetical protein n=1 Tax=Hutsoniella sourekii TaxID=87650 RepID=UPI000488B1B6|nr:hypothetical protein [Hutsoniella sourekii]